MNILITGGAGFIGSHFVDHLINKNGGHKVYVVDKLTYAGNIKSVNEAAELCILDISSPEIEGVMDILNIDTVINFAAETHVDRSISDPKAFVNTDIVGLVNLIHICVKRGIDKFVHISTDEVYGSIDEGMFTEIAKLNPTSPYSASKASADLLLQAFHKTYDLPVVIVRPSNNFGIRQYPEKLIPMTILRLLKGENAIIHGDGRETREWLHVSDCVEGIYSAMMKGHIGRIYNLGSMNWMTNREVVHCVLDVLNLRDDRISYISNRPGNDYRYAISSEKAKRELGFKTFSDFYAELENIVSWYSDNPSYWEDIDVSANIYTENTDYLR